MKRLTAEDRISRRVFDWRIATRMSRRPYTFTAHRTAQDAEAGSRPITSEEGARVAVHYRAEYRIRTLIGAGRYSELTVIRIDLSDAHYPFSKPAGWVIEGRGSVTPWSPHFAPGIPVCNGTVWDKPEEVTFGHYLIHLARLLNWDERLSPGYRGYNGQAVDWWRTHLNRPLTPELRYPALPVELLYGEVTASDRAGFRAVRHAGSVPAGTFRPSVRNQRAFQ